MFMGLGAMMSIVTFMAPKSQAAKSKAKAASKAGSKRAADAEGVNVNALKRMHSKAAYLQHKKKQGLEIDEEELKAAEQAMDIYKSCSGAAAKNAVLAKFEANNKSFKWANSYQHTESHQQDEEQEQVKGWMTVYDYMKLRSYPPLFSDQQKVDLAQAELEERKFESRDHEIEAWKAKGIKQYNVIETKLQVSKEKSSSSRHVTKETAGLKDEDVQKALKNVADKDPSIKIEHPEYLAGVQFRDVCVSSQNIIDKQVRSARNTLADLTVKFPAHTHTSNIQKDIAKIVDMQQKMATDVAIFNALEKDDKDNVLKMSAKLEGWGSTADSSADALKNLIKQCKGLLDSVS